MKNKERETYLGICFLLRNELDFWNVHGIMNASGLFLIFTFYHKYLKYKKNHNLGNKTIFFFNM